MEASGSSPNWGSVSLLSAAPFIGIQLTAVAGACLLRPSKGILFAALIAYVCRTTAVTAGYHRYFAHRGYKTSRAFQFLLAFAGTLAVQKGPLWWAAHHRTHHRFSDTGKDLHSVKVQGFWWAYCGWILSTQNDETDARLIPDFWQYPELRWLNRYHLAPPLAAGAILWLGFGLTAFIWVGLVATTVQWNIQFAGNIFCHMYGGRRFETAEDSRNNFLFGMMLLGEGWHNNHHFYPACARQGFYWWEFDFTYYALLLLQKCGLVWDLRQVPAQVLDIAKAGRKPQPAW